MTWSNILVQIDAVDYLSTNYVVEYLVRTTWSNISVQFYVVEYPSANYMVEHLSTNLSG